MATQTGIYAYNAQGQRAKKTVNGVTTHFIYDQQGRLITENSSDGIQEYVYLNNQPLAKIDATGTTYIHIDHLGTPIVMTDATAAKVWEIENSPFGDNAGVTGTANLNLRFPGQYSDSESGLNYNYFRDYNPAIGRYIQADPIGLRGGINPFAYVQNNPVNWIDPTGLLGQPPGNTLDPGPLTYNPNAVLPPDTRFNDMLKVPLQLIKDISPMIRLFNLPNSPIPIIINPNIFSPKSAEACPKK